MQPGEIVKVLMVIFLAGYMRDKRELLAVPTRRVLGIPAPPLAVLVSVLAGLLLWHLTAGPVRRLQRLVPVRAARAPHTPTTSAPHPERTPA